MLCKTTMRAALAHVLGTVGIVGAFGAGAAPDHPYAAESLSGEAPYSINGSPMGEIVLDVTLDTLLPADTYYLVVNFWTASLTKQLGLTYTQNRADNVSVAADGTETTILPAAGDTTSDPATMAVQPILGTGTGFRFYTMTASTSTTATVAGTAGAISETTSPPHSDVGLTRAFRGDESDTSGAYRMIVGGTTGLPINTHIRLELGTNLAVPDAKAASYRGDLYIYDDLGDARVAARADAPGDVPDNHVFSAHNMLFAVANKIAKPTIAAKLATADVGYERTADPDNDVSSGGPFRGFTAPNQDVGVLATISFGVMEDVGATRDKDEGAFLDASDGSMMFDGQVNTHAKFVVTSDVAGAFGFGNGAGDGNNGERKRTGDNPDTPAVETDYVLNAGGPPTAFRISPMGDACGGTPLVLSAPNADGDQVSIDPLATTNPTFSASATQGEASMDVTDDGEYQLCVNVSTNEVAIPNVGDDRMMDGYMMTVTPMSGPKDGRIDGPAASDEAGAIDRNGTTVNITYLSAHPAYNQRLVIVNRGTREAEFWMDEFQTESDVNVTSGEIRGTVAAMSRAVIRVQDVLSVDHPMKTRAAGTLNLTAAEGDVDIMTLQVHPGTGQIDTTTY